MNESNVNHEELKPIKQSTLSELFQTTQRKVIIKNPDVLNPDAEFIPHELYYRQDQVLELARYFSEIMNGLKPGHVVIRGQSGTGKTLTMKFVLNGFVKHAKENGLKIGVAYASAHQMGFGENAALSPNRYLGELMKSMGFEIKSKKRRRKDNKEKKDSRGGIGWNGMMERWRDFLNEQDFSYVIIVCDDAHRLKNIPFIMHFARPQEVWGLKHDNLTVFFITDESQFVRNIPREALYSFENMNLYFPPYNAMELYGIMHQRLEYALHTPEVIPDSIVRYIAAKVAQKEGDARYALRVLHTIVKYYITLPEEKITEKSVENAFINIDQEDYTRAVNALPNHAKIILLLILKHGFGVIDTSKLYREYSSFIKDNMRGFELISFRRFYDYLTSLEMEDIISWYTYGKGRGRGKKSEVQLKNNMIAVKGIIDALKSDDFTQHLVDWDKLEAFLEKAHNINPFKE